MALTRYKQKRSFTKTPEPQGGKARSKGLRFVIQKHDASHLHYDFRLEMEGVLKSWAVPKGPSSDPKVKRLAMMVEDHPYDYRSFEGIIPEGNYGAGTVIVWDEGTYVPAGFEGSSKSDQDKELRHQLHKGKIKFVLYGEKLKGEYALVKANGRGENGWLLMKLNDERATTKDILLNEKSVLSGKTIDTIKNSRATAVYGRKASTPEVTRLASVAKKVAKKKAVKKKAVKKKSALAKKTSKKKKHLPR